MKQKKLPKETRSFSVTKFSDKGTERQNIEVVVEKPFQILINDQQVANIMLTPSFLDEFFKGFLFGQGIITDGKQIKKTLIEPEKGLLWAEINEPAQIDLTKSLITSGCAGGVTFDSSPLSRESGKSLPQLKKAELPDTIMISRLMKEMISGGKIYREAGGVHSACLASAEEGIIFRVEDIGRHNCIDKVIGYLINKNINIKDKIILTTGRLSLEAVPKVARVGIGILGSRSTPTDLAIDLAKKLNVKLLGYVRSSKATLYS